MLVKSLCHAPGGDGPCNIPCAVCYPRDMLHVFTHAPVHGLHGLRTLHPPFATIAFFVSLSTASRMECSSSCASSCLPFTKDLENRDKLLAKDRGLTDWCLLPLSSS